MTTPEKKLSHIPYKMFASAVYEAKNILQYMAETGCTGFDCSEQTLKKLKHLGEKKTNLPDTLESIRADIGDCKLCKLCHNRNNIVYGKGNPNARLMFIGQSPGYEEDKQAKPFLGEQGQLLTNIIKAINLSRNDVYLCYIVKCQTPKNRLPAPDEISTCFSFLKRKIKVIKPEFICTLGDIASQTLLQLNKPVDQLRGCFHDYQGIKLVATYAPELLIQYPDKKRQVWDDMKMLIKEMK